jgi:hypothetical protein
MWPIFGDIEGNGTAYVEDQRAQRIHKVERGDNI